MLVQETCWNDKLSMRAMESVTDDELASYYYILQSSCKIMVTVGSGAQRRLNRCR